MEKGESNSAESLVSNAERMENNKLSPSDKKITLEALQDTIECIEVNQLRGSILDRARDYILWKALLARTGKVLLKFHKPVEDAILNFDPLLIDP